MKNIMINILVRKETDKDELLELIKKCTSEKYNISVNICDYCLKKSAINLESLSNASYYEFDYEDMNLHENKIIELAGDVEYLAFIDIDSSMQLEENFINDLEIEALEDESIGSVYSDFYSRTKTDRRVHVHQKSFPLVTKTLPLIAFSMRHYVKNQGNESAKGLMLSSMISKHIPKALCSILND